MLSAARTWIGISDLIKGDWTVGITTTITASKCCQGMTVYYDLHIFCSICICLL